MKMLALSIWTVGLIAISLSLGLSALGFSESKTPSKVIILERTQNYDLGWQAGYDEAKKQTDFACGGEGK